MATAELALARQMRTDPTDLAAMGHLAGSTGPVGPPWLSGRLGLTPAAATEPVDRLERVGHVERRRDSGDRRRVRLLPSESALGGVGGRLVPLLAALDTVVAGFSSEQRQTILDYLGQVGSPYVDFARPSPEPDGPQDVRSSAASPGGTLRRTAL